MRALLLFLLLTTLTTSAQSINPERIARLKAATVKVLVDGSKLTGSGFFISASGELLTCWHVIEPAFVYDSTGRLTVRKIYIQFADGQQFEAIVPIPFYDKLYMNAFSKDYCVLTPVQTLRRPFVYLKTGNFDHISEGQEVYSCGFPVNAPVPFVSKGFFSSKYTDSSSFIANNGIRQRVFRETGLLGLVMDPGSSGGPVIKAGATVDEDEVIGIANFTLSPYGHELNKLSNTFGLENPKPNDDAMAILANSYKLFENALLNATTGISACLSINVFLRDIQLLKK